MFIFVEDAKKREREYLMSNGRSEKRQTTILESMSTRKEKQRSRDRTPPAEDADLQSTVAGPSKPLVEASTSRGGGEEPFVRPEGFDDTTSDEDEDEEASARRRAMISTPTTTAGFKRKRPPTEDDCLSDLSSSGAEELITATDKSSKNASTLGKRRDAFVTPSAAHTTDMENGMVTPSLTMGRSVERRLFQKPETGLPADATTAKRQRLDDDNGSAATTSHAPESARLFGTDATISTTPPLLPAASSQPSPSPIQRNPMPQGASPGDLTKDVMDLLKNQDIAPLIRSEIRKVLEKHANLAKGFELGRDSSRKAVKDAEERAARLQETVDSLEKSRQELRTQLMELWNRI